jgi:molybdate transport system permease protein
VNRRTPLGLITPAAVGVAFLGIPLVAVIAKAPWRDVPSLVWSSGARTALRISLECSGGALLLSLLVGVPLAWVLARLDFPGKSVLRSLIMVPLVLPPVVGGVALLLAFGRHGLLPLHIAFTTWAAIAAEAFVSLPFLVLAVEGALLSLEPQYEEVAATLGHGALATFRRVTVPLVAPALAAGAALAWARALGEFGATVTFAGSLPGTTQTLPSLVYLELENSPEEAVAVSVVLLVVSVLVLFLLRGRWHVSR